MAQDAAPADQPAAQPRIRLIRSWPEDAIVRGKRVAARIELWFDYNAGVVTERLTTSDRKGGEQVLRSETFAPGVNVPGPSREEIAEAMAIVRADSEMALLISGARAELDGGFEIFEPAGAACAPGTRCLKIQIMTDNRLGTIRNVVVDLTKQEIVYRAWSPSGPWGKK